MALPHKYVEDAPDGGFRIAGSRVSLDSIVTAYWNGRTPESIAVDFPTLTLEQIHGALAHYLRYRELVDRDMATRQADWDRLRLESESRNGPMLKRIRGAMSAVGSGSS